MVANWKVLLIEAYRVQMLRESVTESALGLSDVEETTLGAMDAVDQTINNLITSGDLPSTASNLIVPQPRTTWVAMGTRVGLNYPCLFVGYVEQSLFCSYSGTIPQLFLRYIDDCIGATSCSHEELEQFIHFANTFHTNLKFTWTISDTSLSFLDLSITISTVTLDVVSSTIGETKHRLGDRFVEHLHSECFNRQHLPVGSHINSSSNSL
eukprot:g41537.t1